METSVSSVYSVDAHEGGVVIGGKNDGNLYIQHNDTAVTFDGITVKGEAVSILQVGGVFYALYADNDDTIQIMAFELPTYDLVLEASQDYAGTVSDLTDSGPYAEGAMVDIKAEPAYGYSFDHWSAPAGDFDDVHAEETTFTMPGEDVTITGHFTYMGEAGFIVDPDNDALWGHGWEEDANLTITIGEDTFAAKSGEWEGMGPSDFFFASPTSIDFGETITVNDGMTTKVHVVRVLGIAEVDEENDIVTGFAEPEAEIRVEIQEGEDSPYRDVTADGSGQWTADFSLADPTGTYDITEETNIAAVIWDAEGDSTRVHHYSEGDPGGHDGPHFSVTLIEGGNISGYQWPESTSLNVTIERDESIEFETDILTDPQGEFYIHMPAKGFTMAVGDVVTITDGGDYTASTVIRYIAVTGFEGNVILGEADPGAELHVVIFAGDGPFHEYPQLHVTTITSKVMIGCLRLPSLWISMELSIPPLPTTAAILIWTSPR